MFDEINEISTDPQEMFQWASRTLVEAGQFHQLFDLRLVQKRHELGLDQQVAIEDLSPPLLRSLEVAYLDACREAGQLLLDAGKPRAAWLYLRPAREKLLLRRWLERTVPDGEHTDELIELALHEGIDPERGLAWLLAQRGTCNAITELDAVGPMLSVGQITACAGVLVRHLYDELLGNLRGSLTRAGVQDVPQSTIRELMDTCPDKLAATAPHVDASHLASTMRYARLLQEPSVVRKALEMAEYGQLLAADFQYPDQSPFEETYPTHAKYFRAVLGEEVDQALEYFLQRAEQTSAYEFGTLPIETYLMLLLRVGRAGEALKIYGDLVQGEYALSPFAPTPLQLAESSGQWDRYFEFCATHNDVVGFAIGQLQRQGKVPSQC